jgi:DnaK suppressor protein
MATKKKGVKKKANNKKVVKKKSPVKKKATAKKVVKKKSPVKKKATAKKVVKKKSPVKSKATAKKVVKKKSPVKKKATATKVVKKKSAVKKTSIKKKPATKAPTNKKAVKAKVKPAKVSTAKVPTTKNKAKQSSLKSGKLRLIKQELPNLDPAILKIRERLIANRSELMKLIRSSQSVERDAGDLTFSNEIDLASSLEGREMIFQLSSRDRNELKLIEDTLFRINGGTYGKCESCEKKISLKRLQIMPLTALCIECQEAAENA